MCVQEEAETLDVGDLISGCGAEEARYLIDHCLQLTIDRVSGVCACKYMCVCVCVCVCVVERWGRVRMGLTERYGAILSRN